jgi:peptidoglycan-associated lipoprotein
VNAKRAQTTTSSPSDEDLFARNVKDVLFDYNKSDIRTDQALTTHNDAAFLGQHPSIKVVVEGHCDDRGSEEYNLALGTSRAESVKRALLQEGVSADRIKTVSYGKEKPFCTEDNDQCWQQNRVDHFNIAR